MKKRIKYCFALAVACAMLTSCTLWEDEWTECLPPPEIEIPVTPDSWEPPVTDDENSGN